MRAVIQRVSQASVEVEGEVVGEIERGLCVLIGAGKEDGPGDLRYIVDKISNLRIFPDDEGKMNRSVLDIGGGVLAISQFTLYGDARKGRRPSFISAGDPVEAERQYEEVVRGLRDKGIAKVATGRFQTHMNVSLTNDGPVTILLDSTKQF